MSLQKIFRGCFQLKHAREHVSPVAGQGGRRAVWSTQTSAAQHRPVIGFTCSRNLRFKLRLLPICEARGVMRLANISNIRYVTFLARLAYRRAAQTLFLKLRLPP